MKWLRSLGLPGALVLLALAGCDTSRPNQADPGIEMSSSSTPGIASTTSTSVATSATTTSAAPATTTTTLVAPTTTRMATTTHSVTTTVVDGKPPAANSAATPNLAQADAFCVTPISHWDSYNLRSNPTYVVFYLKYESGVIVQTPSYQHSVDRAPNGHLRVDGMFEDGSTSNPPPWPIAEQIRTYYDSWQTIVTQHRNGTKALPGC